MKHLLAAAISAVLVGTAWAQAPATGAGADYPAKIIKIIVPFTAGSATDIMARIVGERLSASVGQPVVVENRPGAGGTLGAAQVAKSEPDGYTLLVVSTGHVVNPALYGNLPYDPDPKNQLPPAWAAAPAAWQRQYRGPCLKGYSLLHSLFAIAMVT